MKLTGNPQKLLEEARSMQDRLKSELGSIRVEASTGGGMVSVTMDGNKSVVRVHIDPVAAEDVEMLQDMVRGACNEAVKRVEEAAQRKIGGLMSGLGLPSLGG